MYAFGEMISDVRADFERYSALFRPGPKDRPPATLRVLLSSPGFLIVALYRLMFWVRSRHRASGSMFFGVLLKLLGRMSGPVGVVLAKTQIAEWPTIGPGLYLSDDGGIILGARAFGAGCVIHHAVTVGMDKNKGHPEIGDRVWIGPNTIVYGGIKIGSGAVICGSTVVSKHVPDGCVVEGNPGRIVRRGFDNARMLASADPHADAVEIRVDDMADRHT